MTFSRLDSSTAPILLTEGFTESRFGFALSSAGDTNNDGSVIFKIVTFILVILVNVTLTLTTSIILMAITSRYEDLAVGAPYHRHGAVFLFQVWSSLLFFILTFFISVLFV